MSQSKRLLEKFFRSANPATRASSRGGPAFAHMCSLTVITKGNKPLNRLKKRGHLFWRICNIGYVGAAATEGNTNEIGKNVLKLSCLHSPTWLSSTAPGDFQMKSSSRLPCLSVLFPWTWSLVLCRPGWVSGISSTSAFYISCSVEPGGLRQSVKAWLALEAHNWFLIHSRCYGRSGLGNQSGSQEEKPDIWVKQSWKSNMGGRHGEAKASFSAWYSCLLYSGVTNQDRQVQSKVRPGHKAKICHEKWLFKNGVNICLST